MPSSCLGFYKYPINTEGTSFPCILRVARETHGCLGFEVDQCPIPMTTNFHCFVVLPLSYY